MRKNRKIALCLLSLLTLSCQAKEPQPPAPTPVPQELASTPGAEPQPANSGPLALCETLCAHGEKLGCGSPDPCKQACAQMTALPLCQEQLQAFFTCLSQEPTDHFECNEAGIPSIKDGFCEPQQQAFIECASQ